ncbi:MAG: efflux RND transporter periplasmic adaptor subunit [Pseudomonadota bacterium]|nr:efflux RND transporter periplasmic adaptor subunit [Pseudomonadota bacterium]
MTTPSKFRIVVFCISTSLLACAPAENPDQAAAGDVTEMQAQPLPVRVVQPRPGSEGHYLTFMGTARAANRVTIRSQIRGRLLERKVKLGDVVEENEVLARVYNPGATPSAMAAKQSWEQAKVEAEQAQRDYVRIKSLREKQVASIQESEAARSRLLGARAAKEAAESRYQQAVQVDEEQVLRAPFSGVITATPVEPGEVIEVGQALLQLADPDEVEVEVIVSDAVVSSVQRGDQLPVQTPFSGDRNYNGIVREVTPFRERGALPTVVVRVAEADLNPGTTVYIQFASAYPGDFAVPVTSVIKTGYDKSAVYRLTGDAQVELVPVIPLQVVDNLMVLNGDLDPQDNVVSAGNHQLFPGAKVRVVP